jgi:hypothetical protein
MHGVPSVAVRYQPVSKNGEIERLETGHGRLLSSGTSLRMRHRIIAIKSAATTAFYPEP